MTVRADRPPLLLTALYCWAVGVFIIGVTGVVGDLLEGFGGGLTLGAQLGIALAGVLVAVLGADPAIRWIRHGEGRR